MKNHLFQRVLAFYLVAVVQVTVVQATIIPATLQAQEQNPLVVMTSYPDEMVSRFEAAFGQVWPEYQLQILWRSSEDAQHLFAQSGNDSSAIGASAGVDVYWAPSPRNFALFSAQGLFQPLDAKYMNLPGVIGNTVLRDENAMYMATEVAGYGFVISPDTLVREGLPAPRDWKDLISPEYAGLISLPAPSVGFAPVMIDIVLQAYGWDAGWELWSELTANARLVRRGASFIQDELQSGVSAIGVTIDFFAASAIAGGAPLEFIYPVQNGLNPAHIAIFKNTNNKDAVDAFVDFVLSIQGQELLAHPDIRKLPVNPEVYQQLPASYHNPFAVAGQGGYRYNSARGQSRLPIVAAIFEQALALPQPQLTELWRSIQGAEQGGKDMSAARALLGRPLISEEEADAIADIFLQTATDEAAQIQRDLLLQQWQADIQQQLELVAGML